MRVRIAVPVAASWAAKVNSPFSDACGLIQSRLKDQQIR
jgi:hypothetical protein